MDTLIYKIWFWFTAFTNQSAFNCVCVPITLPSVRSLIYTRNLTYLIMAGLEGAPGAVESHLHRGEGQIGHKILATLCITILHLKEKANSRQTE